MSAPLDPGQPHLAEALSALTRLAGVAEAQAEALVIKTGFGQIPAPSQPDKPMPAFVIDGAPVVKLVDLRLLLAQIAVQTGAKDPLPHGLRRGLWPMTRTYDARPVLDHSTSNEVEAGRDILLPDHQKTAARPDPGTKRSGRSHRSKPIRLQPVSLAPFR